MYLILLITVLFVSLAEPKYKSQYKSRDYKSGYKSSYISSAKKLRYKSSEEPKYKSNQKSSNYKSEYRSSYISSAKKSSYKSTGYKSKGYKANQNRDQYVDINIEIKYKWNIPSNDTKDDESSVNIMTLMTRIEDTYTIKYSSLWGNITNFLSKSEFKIKSKTDKTANKQNIEYNYAKALNLSKNNVTKTWDMNIDITTDTKTSGRKLVTYVNGGLSNDIMNKYNGYWGVLDIIYVACDDAPYQLTCFTIIYIIFWIMCIE